MNNIYVFPKLGWTKYHLYCIFLPYCIHCVNNTVPVTYNTFKSCHVAGKQRSQFGQLDYRHCMEGLPYFFNI